MGRMLTCTALREASWLSRRINPNLPLKSCFAEQNYPNLERGARERLHPLESGVKPLRVPKEALGIG